MLCVGQTFSRIGSESLLFVQRLIDLLTGEKKKSFINSNISFLSNYAATLSTLSLTCTALHHTMSYRRVTDAHLIADEFPLLLVVILPQQSCFVRRKIHRVLRERKKGQS